MDARDEDRLADELARLLDGATDPMGHPSSADGVEGSVDDELAEMLVLASSLREVEAPSPRPEFRAELRGRILREAEESSLAPSAAPSAPPAPSWSEQVRTRLAEVWHSGAIATASIVGAVVLLGVGIVAASEHAQPGDLLYGVKQASEQLRLTLASDEAEVGQLHLRLAERRLDEVATGAGTESRSELTDGLDRMDRHTAAGASILLGLYHEHGETSAARDLRDFTERQRERLEATAARLPVAVVPFAEDSLALLDRIDAELDALVLHGCVPCAELPGGPVGESGSDRCCEDRDRQPAEVSVPSRDVDRQADADAPLSDEPTDTDGSELEAVPTATPDTTVTDDVRDTTDEITDGTRDLLDGTRDLLDDADDDLGDLVDETTEDTSEDLGGLLED